MRGAYPVSARAVRVRDPAYTQERPIESTETQIVALTRSMCGKENTVSGADRKVGP